MKITISLDTIDGSQQQRQLADKGAYEPHISGFLSWLIARMPGAVLFDVGANIGYYTVLGSRLVGPGGQVVAFEPSESARRVLAANIRQNDCRNVRVCPQVVGDGRTRVRLVEPEDFGEGAYAVEDGRGTPAVSIDAFCAETGIWPSVIKSDAEGRDLDVVAGALQALEHRGAVVILEFQPAKIEQVSAIDRGDLFSRLAALGYTPHFFRGHIRAAAERIDFEILDRIYRNWVAENNAAHLDILLWPPHLPPLMKPFRLPEAGG